MPVPPIDFGAPVKPPAITVGLDARALAARERAALKVANTRLRNDRTFYNAVSGHY